MKSHKIGEYNYLIRKKYTVYFKNGILNMGFKDVSQNIYNNPGIPHQKGYKLIAGCDLQYEQIYIHMYTHTYTHSLFKTDKF